MALLYSPICGSVCVRVCVCVCVPIRVFRMQLIFLEFIICFLEKARSGVVICIVRPLLLDAPLSKRQRGPAEGPLVTPPLPLTPFPSSAIECNFLIGAFGCIWKQRFEARREVAGLPIRTTSPSFSAGQAGSRAPGQFLSQHWTPGRWWLEVVLDSKGAECY